MSINTRRKRQNVAWVGFPGPVSVLPSGAIDAFAREQIAWTYGGIDINPPTPGAALEDKVNLGMRVGTQQADVFMGGFG